MATRRQIQTLTQIQKHVRLIYHTQPNMTARVDAGANTRVSRFIHSPERPDEIVLKTILPQAPTHSDVQVEYQMDGFEHHFISRILNFKPLGKVGSFLKIHLPKAIHAVNRRNYLRIIPDEQTHVLVTLHLPDRAPICRSIQDISMGGFSLIVPPGDNTDSYPSEMKIDLHLPDHGRLASKVRLRNLLHGHDGLRIGAEFSPMSNEIQKHLMDFIVAQTLKNRYSNGSLHSSQRPLLCIIHDNQKVDAALNYLEHPYRLVRQDIKADWKPLAKIAPDALLFNLDTIKPDALLSRIRRLNHLQQTPAIIITDGEKVEVSCEATCLLRFKDPAALIETVEHTISLYHNFAPPANPLVTSASAKTTQNDSNTMPRAETILILDLKQNISAGLVKAIETHGYGVRTLTALQGIFEQVKKIEPVLIVIHSECDASLSNLLRILSINRFTQTLPVSILADREAASQCAFLQNMNTNILSLPTHLNPEETARQLIAILQK